MGRGDQDKRLRRAGEQVDRALARREVEAAIDAVLGLDKAVREPLLGLVAPAFRATVLDSHRTAAWGRLHTLAARSEQEPRLLLDGADEAAAASARWPLVLACLRARDFGRAARLWKLLVDRVSARAPALARAMAAWIEGQGQLDPDALAALDLDRLPAPPAPDPRPGVESSTRNRPAPPPAPTSVDQVDGALCALFAMQPLLVVSDTLRGWLEHAPVEVARALRTRAGSLAVRELLIQAGAKESVALPAGLLVRIAAGGEDDLVSELLLATRLLVTRVACPPSRRGEAESLAELAGALIRTRAMSDLGSTLVSNFTAFPQLVPTAIAICQGVIASARSLPDERLFAIWGTALMLTVHTAKRCGEDSAPVSGPAWLQAASREACKRAPALARFLDDRDADLRFGLLEGLLWGQPSEVTADLIDALWDHASEQVRGDLAELLPDLIDNAEEAGMHALENSHSMRDLSVCERIFALAKVADPDLPFLAVGGLALWRRFGPRLLPYCVRLLPYAASQAKPGQRWEVVHAYLDKRVDSEAWLDAIRELSAAAPGSMTPLVEQTLQTMLERFREDPTELARALVCAERTDAPPGLLKRLAHAYQRAVLAQEGDGAEATPEDVRAREILGFLFGGRGTKRPKPRAKPRSKRPSDKGKKGGASAGASGQLSLPLAEDEP